MMTLLLIGDDYDDVDDDTGAADDDIFRRASLCYI